MDLWDNVRGAHHPFLQYSSTGSGKEGACGLFPLLKSLSWVPFSVSMLLVRRRKRHHLHQLSREILFIHSSSDSVGELGCPVCSFVRTDIVTMISHEWLEQLRQKWPRIFTSPYWWPN